MQAAADQALGDNIAPRGVAGRARSPMAIVGMSCRFPGSRGAEAYHRSLIGGADLFSPPPRERWPWCGNDRIAVPKVGALDDVLDFDNGLFRLSPREAETIDPHQRVMLEEAWLAIENAGYAPEEFRRRSTGTFVAMYNQDFQFYARAGDWDEISRIYLAAGSARSLVPNRISYVFDFRGPSEIVDTACSSALVAVHRAVEAIRNGECEQAVVGAVSLLLEPSRLVMLQELGLLSPSGECAPFDRDSGGQVLGEGVAALVIKPLEAALDDRDTIHALILANGVNHQGASSGGLTRPDAAAQADLVRQTYRRHGLDPRQVAYVEAHGNGGGGDLSELLAFQAVFAEGVRIGSVKGNIGFLEAAGGMSQIIKIVMAIRRGMVPGTRGHRSIVEDTELRPGACRILSENIAVRELSAGIGQAAFTAAVHAYGLGGCNAHIVLSEPPPPPAVDPAPDRLPILLSGDEADDLREQAERLLQWLDREAPESLADLAFTLAAGRSHRACRRAFLVSSRSELALRLCDLARGATQPQHAGEDGAGPPDDRVGAAARRWLAGETVDWGEVLKAGRRTAIDPTPLRRRYLPLPNVRAE
ncbi:beta-ketoacyl synthase N-terminal-like domain-containing protein [Nitratireductor alexandrii]|uniref:beta-ketoacyl synthase N-terminal-like domain-containing protein n=1 Tax=Nitratireductor alexandrii TaxID=2448161 RepID=UPI000FD78DD2|nr:polyketide synthase [Nitratireductor alexandrii]